MPIESYERCVTHLSERLFAMLSGQRGDRVARLITATVATNGIYIPAFATRARRNWHAH